MVNDILLCNCKVFLAYSTKLFLVCVILLIGNKAPCVLIKLLAHMGRILFIVNRLELGVKSVIGVLILEIGSLPVLKLSGFALSLCLCVFSL